MYEILIAPTTKVGQLTFAIIDDTDIVYMERIRGFFTEAEALKAGKEKLAELRLGRI